MAATIQTVLALLAVLVAVAVVARRLDIAPSILLVIAGIALALIPSLPRIELAPGPGAAGDVAAADLFGGRRHELALKSAFVLRLISLLAFGCVVFTTCAVAAAVHWLLKAVLAAGFVLGAIPWRRPTRWRRLAIVRRLGLPRRLVVALEGEGLANWTQRGR